MAIRDKTLELNADHDGTAFLTATYVNGNAYLDNDELVFVMDDAGGTAWNLCVWDGCPHYLQSGGMTGKITCAYGQSQAFRQFIPFFDEEGNLEHLQMNWIQSVNLLREQGLPADQSTVQVFMAVLEKVGDYPSDAPVPEPDMD